MKRLSRVTIPSFQVEAVAVKPGGALPSSSTADDRRTKLVTDLGVFEVGGAPPTLAARHAWATESDIEERTGFMYDTPAELPVTHAPDEATLHATRALDAHNLRHAMVG